MLSVVITLEKWVMLSPKMLSVLHSKGNNSLGRSFEYLHVAGQNNNVKDQYSLICLCLSVPAIVSSLQNFCSCYSTPRPLLPYTQKVRYRLKIIFILNTRKFQPPAAGVTTMLCDEVSYSIFSQVCWSKYHLSRSKSNNIK